MSNNQKIALCSTWKQIKQQQTQLYNLIKKIFCELSEKETIVKQIFCKANYINYWEKASSCGNNNNEQINSNLASMEKHIKILIKFIDDLIQYIENDKIDNNNCQIDGNNNINNNIKIIGQQHAVKNKIKKILLLLFFKVSLKNITIIS
jgi:hypothetical protein